MPEPILSVHNLSIVYQARRGQVQAVRNISFDVERGEALALIGESGSGKTTIGLGLMHLLPTTAKVISGSAIYRRSPNGSALESLRRFESVPCICCHSCGWIHSASGTPFHMNSQAGCASVC